MAGFFHSGNSRIIAGDAEEKDVCVDVACWVGWVESERSLYCNASSHEKKKDKQEQNLRNPT